MESIDAIKINFSPDQLILLNWCLAFLMFGVALDIRIGDFKAIFKKPKAPLIGLFCQLVLLPILTLTLIYILRPPASISIGMILIAVCPGGNVSNFMVHLAKANAALSVMLTSIVTLGAVIITPVSFAIWSKFLPGGEAIQQSIYVAPLDMIKTIILLIFIPLAAGMAVLHFFPKLTAKITSPIRILSILIFFGFVVAAIYGNYQNIVSYLHIVFFVVIIHNSLALLMGYSVGKLGGLSIDKVRAITIETGIQNSGLALILIFNFFDGIGGMAMVAAWWGIWHLIAGFSLAMYWRKSIVN